VDQAGSQRTCGEEGGAAEVLKTPPHPTSRHVPSETSHGPTGSELFFPDNEVQVAGLPARGVLAPTRPRGLLITIHYEDPSIKVAACPAGAGDETFRETSFAVSLPGDDRFLNARERSHASSSYE
jgi:hypothetical protein